ncbi:MAG: four helix bundle protein [Candidatus Berkelbacteria bacterium]
MSREIEFENRLLRFSTQVIELSKNIKETNISRPIINQLVRSATSVGANYIEANNASSKKDFKNKIFICKKEGSETKYWLKLLQNIEDEHKIEIEKIWSECNELCLIFHKIVHTMNQKDKIDKFEK